jgi:hypothetical protein
MPSIAYLYVKRQKAAHASRFTDVDFTSATSAAPLKAPR